MCSMYTILAARYPWKPCGYAPLDATIVGSAVVHGLAHPFDTDPDTIMDPDADTDPDTGERLHGDGFHGCTPSSIILATL